VAWDEEGRVVGKGNFETQERQIFENMKRILEAAGAHMSDIVWIMWLCKDIRDGLTARQLPPYEEYFGEHEPPGTLIQVSNLGEPELLLEVQAIAVVDG
jgi:enamine deaminase RidA (YjgF/YER057c/UK114 family)